MIIYVLVKYSVAYSFKNHLCKLLRRSYYETHFRTGTKGERPNVHTKEKTKKSFQIDNWFYFATSILLILEIFC